MSPRCYTRVRDGFVRARKLTRRARRFAPSSSSVNSRAPDSIRRHVSCSRRPLSRRSFLRGSSRAGERWKCARFRPRSLAAVLLRLPRALAPLAASARAAGSARAACGGRGRPRARRASASGARSRGSSPDATRAWALPSSRPCTLRGWSVACPQRLVEERSERTGRRLSNGWNCPYFRGHGGVCRVTGAGRRRARRARSRGAELPRST